MAKEIKEKNIVFIMLSVVLFITLLFLFVVFLEQNYWWILPAIFYFAFFAFRESELRFRDLNKKLRIKERSETRIDFWG